MCILSGLVARQAVSARRFGSGFEWLVGDPVRTGPGQRLRGMRLHPALGRSNAKPKGPKTRHRCRANDKILAPQQVQHALRHLSRLIEHAQIGFVASAGFARIGHFHHQIDTGTVKETGLVC
jgi:hypothetical protein